MVITNFLLDDQAVANLIDSNAPLENDYVEVKFLQTTAGSTSGDNDLLDNDTLDNGKKMRKKAKKNGKKKKKSKSDDYDPHEVIVHFQNDIVPDNGHPYQYDEGYYGHGADFSYEHAGYHHTHPELSHQYDDAHDVTPVDFNDHAVLKAFDHPDSHSYHANGRQDGFVYDTAHHGEGYYVHEGVNHHTHPELSHKYDDAHDVTPTDYHEHAVLKALPHEDSHSYGYYD